VQKTALAIRHVHFEDLGTLEAVLVGAGYDVRYHDVGADDLDGLDALAPDLLVMLGGPIGVYETDTYPFLAQERALLQRRLAANCPTLGICLGAQQIAHALGADVKPTGVKEIGFSLLDLTDAGKRSPLRHLAGVPVLHWHGDAFAIPDGADHLAATTICTNQAFAIGANVLALQFHVEADAANGLEPWLIGHAAELSSAGINIPMLRDEAVRNASILRDAARSMLAEWLDGLAL